jgi:succinate-acetate transporter protein
MQKRTLKSDVNISLKSNNRAPYGTTTLGMITLIITINNATLTKNP